MEKDMENIDIIIEKYVDGFRKLLITLLKNKSCDGVFYSENKRKEKKYNYCSHPNYKGKKCKRMVKKVGDLCIFHKQNKEKYLQINYESDNLLNENNNPSNNSSNGLNKLSNKFINKDNSYKDKPFSEKIYGKEVDELIQKENISLDKNDVSFEKLINPSNKSNKNINEYEDKKRMNFDDEYFLSNKIDNPLNVSLDKLDLLDIINSENNKLICYKCRKTLITQKEINMKICDYCYNFPHPSRKKTITKCKFCENNTLNINETCRSCYKKQKRKITIFK
jgi:hypothetical protein